MATKKDLEQVNAHLLEVNAELRAEMAAMPICQRVCPCGLRFHQDPPCYSQIDANDMATACVCPDHPETAPPPKPNVDEE